MVIILSMVLNTRTPFHPLLLLSLKLVSLGSTCDARLSFGNIRSTPPGIHSLWSPLPQWLWAGSCDYHWPMGLWQITASKYLYELATGACHLGSCFFYIGYINCTKGFHCDDISIHAYNKLWSNSPPLFLLKLHLPCHGHLGATHVGGSSQKLQSHFQ
jgi:hypothetical protein